MRGPRWYFNHDALACEFSSKKEEEDSITKDTDYVWFFILQVVVGVGTAIAGTYYNYTFVPPFWWSNLIILAIEFAVVTIMTWYKLSDWKEAFIRIIITTLVIIAVSILFGSIYYWDVAVMLDIDWMLNWPIISAIFGVPISAFLSIALLDSPMDRKRTGKKIKN